MTLLLLLPLHFVLFSFVQADPATRLQMRADRDRGLARSSGGSWGFSPPTVESLRPA